MTLDQMKALLRSELSDEKYVHSINVMKTSIKLAKAYGANSREAAVAGLLHDCAKDLPEGEKLAAARKYGIHVDDICLVQPDLLHGPVGAEIARDKYGITQKEILDAIRTHTMGEEGMSLLQKIIFLADYIEPGRDFRGVEKIRQLAFSDIDGAMVLAYDLVIRHVLSKGALIHNTTVNARNYIIKMTRLPGGRG